MASKNNPKTTESIELSVILPTYNEAQNIGKVIEELEDFFSKKKKPFEIIVVDDSSPDKTADVVRKLQKRFSNIVLIGDCPKEGIGKALSRGYDAGRGNWLLSMDADRAFKTNEIDRLFAKSSEGFDFVVGSKYLKESDYKKNSFGALAKSKISEYGNLYIRIMSRVPLHDFSMNFRLLKKEVWQKIKPKDNENFFLVEMLVQSHRKGHKIAEVGVSLLPRDYGASKTQVWKQSVKFFSKATAFLWS